MRAAEKWGSGGVGEKGRRAKHGCNHVSPTPPLPHSPTPFLLFSPSFLRRRAGFSLLEVMLATSILLGCVIVLSELAGIGRQHAAAAEDISTAQWLCQNRLNQIVAGVAPLESVDSAPLDDDPGWLYSVDVEPVGQAGLEAVRVSVTQDTGGLRPGQTCSLVRWVRDPSYQPGAATTDQTAPPATTPVQPGGTP